MGYTDTTEIFIDLSYKPTHHLYGNHSMISIQPAAKQRSGWAHHKCQPATVCAQYKSKKAANVSIYLNSNNSKEKGVCELCGHIAHPYLYTKSCNYHNINQIISSKSKNIYTSIKIICLCFSKGKTSNHIRIK